jgi:hypothetical protein
MIGTLRREVFHRLLIVNEHHLRQVLTEYLRHYNSARPHRPSSVRTGSCSPGHRRSTSPSTGSVEDKSSADSRTNTRSPSDSPTLLQEESRSRNDRVFEPNRVRRGFRNIRATMPCLAGAQKPGKPGPDGHQAQATAARSASSQKCYRLEWHNSLLYS